MQTLLRSAPWRLWCTLWIGAWLFGMAAPAGAATYAYRNDTFSYDTPSASANVVPWHSGTTGGTNGSPACTSYPLGDDDWADIVFANATTPVNNFTFTFAGTSYSGLRIYSNGMLAFGTDTSGQWRTFTNGNIPYGTALGTYATGCPGGLLSNAIIPYWTDIVAGTGNSTTGASIQYELLGTAPNRRMVISWVNVKLYNQTARYNFQVALYESPSGGLNSNFKFQYTTGSSTGLAATVGVQVNTADATLYSYNQSFIDPVAGSAVLWYPANQLIGKAAEYHFDEALWNGTAGEIKDTSGAGNNGVRVGLASNVANGQVCRGGNIPANTSNLVMDAVSTPITPASVGSIDFWFNANVKWASADAMLFDATLLAGKPFFLMKTATGTLKFSVTDSASTVMTLSSAAQSFALNTWHHVGVSWNLRPGTNQTLLQIFLDGVLTTSLRTTSSGVITPLSTLDLGDNATSGVTPTGGTPNSANGLLDEVNIYTTEINATQATSDMNATHVCKALDHFHVMHNGSALTCTLAPVTIEAHAADHSKVALSGVTMALTTSLAHGSWANVASGSINLVTNNGNGSGSYVFSNESAVTFGLQDPSAIAESLTIGAASGAITTTSGSAATCSSADYTFGSTCNTPLSFSLAGFLFSNSSTGNTFTIPAQVSGITNASPLYLRAVQASTTTPAVCNPAIISQTTAVTVGYTCNNPASCQAGNLATINSTAISSGGTSVSLSFDANASAPITTRYDDVGQITLSASKSITPPGGTAVTLNGSSNALVVAPHHFGFSSISAGPIKAGNNFAATVTAYNGLATPTVTGNFGKETTPEGVTLTSTLVTPNPVTYPAAANPTPGNNVIPGTEFGSGGMVNDANGVATVNNLAWGEVGNITLTAALTNSSGYLGSGLYASATSAAVGPFIPDHFDTAVVTSGGVPMPCPSGLTCPLLYNGFVYSGQPLRVRITAKNLAGGTTTNYHGVYGLSNIVNLSAWEALGSVTTANPPGAGVLGNASVAAAAFASGVALTSGPTYTLPAVLTAPTDIYLRAVDSVNTTVTSRLAIPATSVEGGVKVASGRISIPNVYGSERLALPTAVTVQYWSGSYWRTSSTDSTTAFDSHLASAGGNLVATVVTGLGGGMVVTGPAVASVINGVRTITLAAPLVFGSANLSLNAPAYLPSSVGRATFGIYKNPLIYRRENY